MMKAAFALLIWGGKVRIISTHFGSANPFNELVVDIRAGRNSYSLHRIDFDEALRDGLYRRIAELTEKRGLLRPRRNGATASSPSTRPTRTRSCSASRPRAKAPYLPLALLEARARDDIPVLRWTQPKSFMMVADTLRAGGAALAEGRGVARVARFEAAWPSWFGMDFGRYVDLSVIWLGRPATACVGARG